jgi:hypothetical protein
MTYLDLFVTCWILCPAILCGVIAALTINQAGVFIEDLLPAIQSPRELLQISAGPAPGVRFLLIIVVVVVHLGGFRRRGRRTRPTNPLTSTPLRKGKKKERKVVRGGGWDDILIIVLVVVILIKGEAPLLETNALREDTDGDDLWDKEAFEEKWAQALENTGFLTPEIMLLEPVETVIVEPCSGEFEAWCEQIEEAMRPKKGAAPKRGREERRERQEKVNRGGRHGGKSVRHGGRRMKATWVR